MVVLSGIAFSSCKPEEKGDYFFSINIFSGEKSQVMKTVKKSFQNAAKSIEDGPNYNQAGVIYTGMKVNLMYTNTDGEGQKDEVVDSHTFK